MNHPRIKIVLVGIAILATIALGVGIFITKPTDTQVEADKTNSQQREAVDSNTVDRGAPEHDDNDHNNHIDPSAFMTFNGIVLSESDILTTYKPFAEVALREYLKQNTSETATERAARLESYFTSSVIPEGKAPSVDPTYSKGAASTADVIYSTWLMDTNKITVTTAMKITTRDAYNPDRTISSVYQSYDCVIVPYNGTYRVSTITYNPQAITLPL